jgi:hypothetical protein
MKLLTKAIEAKLRANALLPDEAKADLKPVLKLFNPCGAATWLITELDADGDTMFGLCDLGFDCAELGNVSLAEIAAVKTRPFGLGIERDRHFKADKTLAEYTKDATAKGRIDA